MRAGLADGLSSSAVAGFLNPGFLRGIGDPYGGGRILAFIVARDDPTLFRLSRSTPQRRTRRSEVRWRRRGRLLGIPPAQRRLRGAGGGPSAGRGRCRHHGGVGERRLSARSADHRSDPGGRQPPSGRGAELRHGGGCRSTRRLRSPRDELPRSALTGRPRCGGQPHGVPRLGGADRGLGGERCDDGSGPVRPDVPDRGRCGPTVSAPTADRRSAC